MNNLRKAINKSVMIYIVGCFCFVIVALVSIYLGYYIIWNYGEHDFSMHLIILSFGGCWLLWEMIKAFNFQRALPDSFIPITNKDFPELFAIVKEITQELDLSPIDEVYLCPDATAAVVIQPQLKNILFSPKCNLVIGMGFLTQLDDNEIRAVLYHEFGHYVQSEMRNSLSVYTIGQFAQSFLSIKEMKKENTWQQQLKSQLLLFTYFTNWVCNRINKDYMQLAKQMEYDADDVAVKYVGAPTLQRALLHAACIRYNYKVIQWGLQQLDAQGIEVDNVYLALHFVGNYSRPTRNLLSSEIVKRVERLGGLVPDTSIQSTCNIRKQAMQRARRSKSFAKLCSADRFALWLQKGFSIYAKQKQLETSVTLIISLDSRKHKLPWFDATYKVLLDGKNIGIGNFIKGYTLKRKTSPGKHSLSVYAPSGIISTPFELNVESDKIYKIDMDYKVFLLKGYYDVFVEKVTMI